MKLTRLIDNLTLAEWLERYGPATPRDLMRWYSRKYKSVKAAKLALLKQVAFGLATIQDRQQAGAGRKCKEYAAKPDAIREAWRRIRQRLQELLNPEPWDEEE